MTMTSSRPYLLRAIFDWLVDNNCTPYIMVNTSLAGVTVPTRYIKNNQIVLNISPQAVRKLIINNKALEFYARFDEAIFHVYAPIKAILGIYAEENGRGMLFDEETDEEGEGGGDSSITPPEPTKPSGVKGSHLRVVK